MKNKSIERNAMNDQTQTHKRKRINYDGQQESIINNENL